MNQYQQEQLVANMAAMEVQPTVELLGNYGLNANHEYVDHGTGLRVLKQLPPSFDFDLLDGFEGNNDQYAEVYNNRKKLHNSVIWMARNRDLVRDESDGKPFNVDFVCGNGFLKRVLKFKFEDRPVKHVFQMSRYKDLILIRRKKKEEFDTNQELEYAGHRFEDYATDYVDDKKGSFYNVLRAEIGGHRLMYTCEVDCIKEQLEREPEISDFVEIKTADPIRDFRTNEFRHGFRQHMSKRWWSQCVMAGIGEVVVGIRDRRREVPGRIRCKNIERISVKELVEHAIGWSSQTGFNFLIELLDKIKEVVTENNPDVVYTFTIETGHAIRFEKSEGSKRILTDDMIEKINGN